MNVFLAFGNFLNDMSKSNTMQTKFGEGNVFSGVCLFIEEGRGRQHQIHHGIGHMVGILKLKHVRHPSGMLSIYELVLYIVGLGKTGVSYAINYTNTFPLETLWMQWMRYPVLGFVQI